MAVKKKEAPSIVGKKCWFLAADATLREGRIESVNGKNVTVRAINMRVGRGEEAVTEMPLTKIHMSND